MDREWWPQVGGPVAGEDIPSVAYLDWYIPKLQQGKEHDLSQSGLQMTWDWQELLAGNVGNLDAWHGPNREDPRRWVAQREGVAVDRVVCCHGVTQGLHLALMGAMPSQSSGDIRSRRVAVEMPSYAPITQTARLLGLETIPFHRRPQPENPTGGAWLLDREEISALLPSVGAIIITNVLNPVGWALTRDDQKWLVKVTEDAGVALVSDEVYDDSLRHSNHYRPMHREGSHCISLNSLTKCFGLGQVRFGWLISSEEVAGAALQSFHTTEGVMASPSLYMAQAVWPHLDKALDRIEEARRENLPQLRKVLEKHGIEWTPPPYGIFGAFPLPNQSDAMHVMETLGEELSILATPGAMFDESLSTWLRVAWGAQKDAFSASMLVLDELLSRL